MHSSVYTNTCMGHSITTYAYKYMYTYTRKYMHTKYTQKYLHTVFCMDGHVCTHTYIHTCVHTYMCATWLKLGYYIYTQMHA